MTEEKNEIEQLNEVDFEIEEPNFVLDTSKKAGISEKQVGNVLSLIDEDNTVHFIARYRKERTGNLDENDIRKISETRDKLVKIFDLKNTALKSIYEQGKLTKALKKKIVDAKTLNKVEDLYAPYKRKKKTKADIAREKGFDPVAKMILAQEDIVIPAELLEKYSEEEIITGAKDIVAQDIADDAGLKEDARIYFLKNGKISSKFKDTKKFKDKQLKEMHKFKIYEEFEIEIKKMKSYQILALNRGEKLDILKVSLEDDEEYYEQFLFEFLLQSENREILEECVKNGYKKIFDASERSVRSSLTEKASVEAIEVFQKNLKNLLMLKPHYGESVLAIDPGYRTGCKVCMLDKNGGIVEFGKIYLDKEFEAGKILKDIYDRNKPDAIVIGNGTGVDETADLIDEKIGVEATIVNESGASVYSVSKVGQEEFPKLDATDRGTISIGRRYIDSLSELVKVPVISIGVGMYQHDMSQKELEVKLSETVQDVVNFVGINVNTASAYLLNYVSGLDKRAAKKIFGKAPYKSRAELEKVLTAKQFEQAIGFLRVPESSEAFDNTGIHPEQYEVARFIVERIDEKDLFNRFKAELEKRYAGITEDVVVDIIDNWKNAGKELRQYEGSLKKKKKIKIEDLKEGDKVNGVVRNVTQFGAFVDIGLKNDGLVHISELANKFVKDPNDVVSVGQEVEVTVISIDLENGKIGLSMKR